ncbi:SMP-30/gluconolactonase/LRE family protein [Aspergillus neoniger CBS 115656]|uniref:Calcium-dependent phosphotriesterase n=1 Tax=Aspergillus neoniger (strain CBS 115656) TaxID=1448310 RepID=A0A318Y521_ASPNB|nr:calcium-dependent phosphotriesterase [Aspergillus neoniger CBS 115656]PYH29335.1 calcium-dependent phosphotriesterase [Aspergillus neoniger CBS 115656]
MNFYPTPPTIQAEIYTRIPSHLRCTGQPTEWRSGSARPASDIFLEGPVCTANGDLYIVDVPYGRVLKINRDKNVTECIRYDGESNGLVVRDDGCLVIADYKQGILLFNPTIQRLTPLLTRRNLERFKGPNDLIFSSKNEIYFTDQGQTGMTDPSGCVYRLSPDGKLDCLVSNGISPNGLVLSPDERFLYVAMTRQNSVWRLPLNADGSTSKVGLFFQSFGCAGPDGLAVDEEGSLFVCHPSLGCVFVVDREGVPKARIVTAKDGGKNLTNCTFGGEDGRTLFITDSLEGNVQVVRWHCRGVIGGRVLKAKI